MQAQERHMKFLFIAPRFHNNQYYWVKSLTDHNHEVRFWVWRKEPLENYSALTPSLIPRSSFGLPKILSCYREMKALDPDIVVVRDPRSFLFVFVSMLIARMQKRKVFIYSQTPLYQTMSWVKKITVRLMLRFFGSLWITPIIGDMRYPKFHPRAFYVPFAIEPQAQEKSPVRRPIRIISVGKIYQERKNHLLLLEAFYDSLKKSDIRLTIIGALSGNSPEYFNKMRVYIKKYDLEQTVEIKTNLEHNEVLREYAKHDLFVLPSSNEPLAYSPLEAMGAGLPVICSDTNGFRWYVKDGENGYIFKSEDVSDLKDKVSLAIPRLQEMSKNSLNSVKQFYTPKSFYEKFMEAVQSV